MEDSVVHVIAAGDPTPASDVLQFVNAPERIRTVTVINQTQMAVALFPGSQVPAGTPAIVVGAMQQQTIPLAAVPYAAVSYQGGNLINGFVYIHYSSEYLAPGSSSLQDAQDTVQWTNSGEANYAVGANQLDIGALSIDVSPRYAYFSKLASLSFLLIHNLPAGTPYTIAAANHKNSKLSNYSPIYAAISDLTIPFATPFPLYNVTSDDNIGDRIDIQLVTANSPAAGTLYFTLGFTLT